MGLDAAAPSDPLLRTRLASVSGPKEQSPNKRTRLNWGSTSLCSKARLFSESLARVPCWFKLESVLEITVTAEISSGFWACQISSKRNGEDKQV